MGKFNAAAGVNWACATCGAGKYQDGTEQTGCKACANGKYLAAWALSSESSNDAAGDCSDCQAGKFHASTGATCKACTYGKWTADSTTGLTECIAIPTLHPTPYPTASPTIHPTKAEPTAEEKKIHTSTCKLMITYVGLVDFSPPVKNACEKSVAAKAGPNVHTSMVTCAAAGSRRLGAADGSWNGEADVTIEGDQATIEVAEDTFEEMSSTTSAAGAAAQGIYGELMNTYLEQEAVAMNAILEHEATEAGTTFVPVTAQTTTGTSSTPPVAETGSPTAYPTAYPTAAPTAAPTEGNIDKLGDIGRKKELLGAALGLIFAGGLFVVWRICHKNSKPDTSKEGVELASVKVAAASV
jgi:hypothetical protein